MRMVVLLCLGLLGACKPGHDHHKDHSEPDIQLNRIAKAAKVAFLTNGNYPKGQSATLPESRQLGCCDSDKFKCPASNKWASDPVWKELDFAIEEPTFFRYTYESTDGQSFTATAMGDLDCDAITITYKVSGSVKDGSPVTTPLELPTNSD